MKHEVKDEISLQNVAFNMLMEYTGVTDSKNVFTSSTYILRTVHILALGSSAVIRRALGIEGEVLFIEYRARGDVVAGHPKVGSAECSIMYSSAPSSSVWSLATKNKLFTCTYEDFVVDHLLATKWNPSGSGHPSLPPRTRSLPRSANNRRLNLNLMHR